mmetsp:Transcript_15335/g.40655  ORF Transcript_15335/g.40655 Transcript_15335/m.40655 type:complete len:269 (+) Transcript_15335:983-1789(+)
MHDIPRALQNVAAEVVPTLALEVGHGVEVGDASHKAALRLLKIRGALGDKPKLALVVDRLHNELPSLLFDRNELADVLALELGPCHVQSHQARRKIHPRGPRVPLRHRRARGTPALGKGAEVGPRLLKTLRVADGIRAELKLVAVHPDGGVLVDRGLEDVHAVVPGVVREERPVVCSEGGAEPTRRHLEARSPSELVDAGQVDRACRVPRFAPHISEPTIKEQLLVIGCQLLNSCKFGLAEGAPVIAAKPTEHGCENVCVMACAPTLA